jgi:hypothetical protein
VVYSNGIHLITVLIEIYDYSHRFTNGHSRITAYYSETRIGIDSRILVHRYSHLSLSPSHVSLAEGNPDEEKIGAFGVGRLEHYLEIIDFLIHDIHRLLQLVLDRRGTVGHLRRYAKITLANSPWFYS